jgi:DNA-directed RNA polymerase subunit F
VSAVEIIEERYIPIPMAKKIMEQFKELIEENPIMARVYEYLSRFSKCDPDNAEKAFEELLKLGFSQFAAAMLINIVPRSVEEAKAILGDIDGGYSDEKIVKAVDIITHYCLGQSRSE